MGNDARCVIEISREETLLESLYFVHFVMQRAFGNNKRGLSHGWWGMDASGFIASVC